MPTLFIAFIYKFQAHCQFFSKFFLSLFFCYLIHLNQWFFFYEIISSLSMIFFELLTHNFQHHSQTDLLKRIHLFLVFQKTIFPRFIKKCCFSAFYLFYYSQKISCYYFYANDSSYSFSNYLDLSFSFNFLFDYNESSLKIQE